MSDFLNTGYTHLHLFNLAVHVTAGGIAIGLGITQYFTVKGSKRHKKLGRVYMTLFAIVLFTAVFGTFMFGFRAFLASLTLSALYALISALRVLKIRESGPRWLDNVLSIGFCAIAIGMIVFVRTHPQESALVIQLALANVVALSVYDLSRNIGGKAWLQKSWLNEHIYKMIGSHSALISAGAGNVLRELQPWSILVPVLILQVLTVFFIIRNPLPKSVIPE